MHIYAFGSLCRGEVSYGSDVDLLAITQGHDPRFDPETFSIYSYRRIDDLWEQGNPFAWHLYLEAKLVFAENHDDDLKERGSPQPYRNCVSDCKKFHLLCGDAMASLESKSRSEIFDLATVFLSIRNFATCFALGVAGEPNFSRHSARRLGSNSIELSDECYSILERARILCTRGYGPTIMSEEIATAISELHAVRDWMRRLLTMVTKDE